MAKSKAAKAGAAAAAVKESQYVNRLIEDDDLRDNIVQAYESVRDAYSRLNSGKSPTKALLDDKKLQKDLREAAAALRDAGSALKDGPQKKRGGLGRSLMLLVVGGAVALAVSEGLRKKVLDALFGAEEEFEYTSVTTPSTATGATGNGSTTASGSTSASGSTKTS